MRSFPTILQTHFNAEAAYIVYIIDMEIATPQYLTNADIKIYYEGKQYLPWGLDFGSMESSITPQLDKLTVSIDNSDYNRGPSSWCMTSDVRGKRFLLRLAVLGSDGGILGTVVKFDGIIDSVPSITNIARFEIYNHMINWTQKLLTLHSASCPHVFKDAADVIVSGSTMYTCIRDHVSASNNKPETGAYWATYWTSAGAYTGQTEDKYLTTEAGTHITTEAGDRIIASVPLEEWGTKVYYRAGTCNYTGGATDCDRSASRCLSLCNYVNFQGHKFLPALADRSIWWGKIPN